MLITLFVCLVKGYPAAVAKRCTVESGPESSRPPRVLKDVRALKEKYIFLQGFSDEFVAYSPLEYLLNMESTILMIQEHELAKDIGMLLMATSEDLERTSNKPDASDDNHYQAILPALEGFFWETDFCREDLMNIDKPTTVLTAFVEYVFGKSTQNTLLPDDLSKMWSFFWHARPESTLVKEPAFTICRSFNLGKCPKVDSSCLSKSGLLLHHVCNHRIDQDKEQSICGNNHPSIYYH
jgi:hypothetical protein